MSCVLVEEKKEKKEEEQANIENNIEDSQNGCTEIQLKNENN